MFQVYKMTSLRGRVLLINNRDFHQKISRKGSDIDVINLHQLFTHMSFIVIPKTNLKAHVGIVIAMQPMIYIVGTD